MGFLEFSIDHLLPQSEAIEETRPFWPEMTWIWNEAWKRYGNVPEEERGMLSYTANVPPIMVFGFTQYLANQVFSGREADGVVRCKEIHGAVAYYLNDKILFKFNSVDEDGAVRNSETNEHKGSYYRQERMFGLTDATRLTVGCIANPVKSGIASLVISCQVGDQVYYKFPIDESNGVSLPMPGPQSAPAPDFVREQLAKKHPR